MPCALGAALACSDRKVINIEADGSAMYTVQALWSQAHEKANVITLICSNRKYFTIEFECRRAGLASLGTAAQALINMDQPIIDWVNSAGNECSGCFCEYSGRISKRIESGFQ